VASWQAITRQVISSKSSSHRSDSLLTHTPITSQPKSDDFSKTMPRRKDDVGKALLNQFRERVNRELIEFSEDRTASVCIKTSLSEVKTHYPIEVLKFIIHDEVDDIGKQKFVTHREETDSDLDLEITVYRDMSFVPPEVLEEMNHFEETGTRLHFFNASFADFG